MKKTILVLLLLLAIVRLHSQNLFPQTVDGCHLSQFCLDCGDPQATYESSAFMKVADLMNSKYNFKGGKGQIMLQVLVDSLGKGCVISHTDASKSSLTQDLINNLNQCTWNPAMENNKAVNSSINILFQIVDDKLTGSVERVNQQNLNENMSNPGTPVVYNKSFNYKNPSLNSYEFSVWQKKNSGLPNDMSQLCVVDNSNVVWYGTYNGFAKFDGKQFEWMNEKNSPFKKTESIEALAVDKQNNKWVFSNESLYKFDNQSWQNVPISNVKVSNVDVISCNDFGETILATDTGVVILKADKIEILTNKQIPALPSNNIFCAYRDKKGRLWIGTYEGSVMIDEKGTITDFNKTSTPIKNSSITEVAEDKDGNLYFALYAYKPHKERDVAQEGFAVFTKDGMWNHYNDSNSGLPANHINSLLYDPFENILWIGTNEAGLVRFDLKGNWENYHNQNSKVPSSYIFGMSQDSNGNIYVSTFNGMLRIHKK